MCVYSWYDMSEGGVHVIRYKFDIMSALKEAGYTTYKMRRDRIFGERVIQKFRGGGLPSNGELNTLCRLLGVQPGDLLEYAPDN